MHMGVVRDIERENLRKARLAAAADADAAVAMAAPDAQGDGCVAGVCDLKRTRQVEK